MKPKLANALVRLLWKQRFTDLGPFRAIRNAALRQLGMDDRICGWTVQMQILAARFGLRCAEVPVDYGRRKGGRSRVFGTVRGVGKAGTNSLASVARGYLTPSVRTPSASESLAIFAKHPESERVKTRLIPALGPEGAAKLYAHMLQHTLSIASQFRRGRVVQTQIWHAGGRPNPQSVNALDTSDDSFTFHAQPDGDLGARMLHAFRVMLREASAAAIIGTDCPELSAGILHAAFDALKKHEVVVGPATDGGYYLIGLRRPVPSLFCDMKWSTDQVLAETLVRASSLGLSVHLLPMLDDVDEPKDLPVWRAVRDSLAGDASPHPPPVPELSIIIPTLHEAQRIAATIESVRQPSVEIIIADGGSADGTRRIAAACGARVTMSPLPSGGRGPQLNCGAALARSERLLFLHADTRLPQDYLEQVRHALADDRTVLGAFRFQLDQTGLLLRLIERAVSLRCAIWRMPFGDQALFMRARDFRRLGGFAPIPLMEDVDLVCRARSLIRGGSPRNVRILDKPAITSARRWTSAGALRTTIVNQLCLLGHALGIPTRRLADWRTRFTSVRPDDSSTPSVPVGPPASSASRAASIAGANVEERRYTKPSVFQTKMSVAGPAVDPESVEADASPP